jgi:hypothetical protein
VRGQTWRLIVDPANANDKGSCLRSLRTNANRVGLGHYTDVAYIDVIAALCEIESCVRA